VTVSQVKTSRGPTSLTEMARLTGEFADWNNLHYLAVWLTGELNIAAVRDAWWRLSLRHDVLRRNYVSPDEACTYEDALSELELLTAQTDAEAIEWMRQFLGTPFSLDGPAFSRIAVVRRGEERHLLGIALDHIIDDLASWVRLLVDFTEFYNRALAGDVGDVGDEVTSMCSYQDFATEQRRLFAGAWGDERRAFWCSYVGEFGTFPPLFSVGAEHTGEYKLAAVTRKLPADAKWRVQEFSRQARATPFTVLTSSVAAAMREVTGDPVVGISANQHGRTLPRTSQTAGLFVQTVPLHLGRQAKSPLETVREMFHRTLDVFEYSIPLLVAGRYWNQTLMVADKAAGLYVAMNDEPPSADSLPPLTGTEAENVHMDFPGAKRVPETVVVDWNLYETRPELVARYNENYFPGAPVEQLLEAAERFALSAG
jgi:Condensation domain